MKLWKRVIGVLLVLSILAGTPVVLPVPVQAETASDVQIYDLMTDDQAEPVGLDDPAPVFSWKMRSAVIGQCQTAYQLVVKQGDETVWDSGKVESGVSVGITYGGSALQSSTIYTWTVTVWDKDGNSVLSPTASFETALMGEDAASLLPEDGSSGFISYSQSAQVLSDATAYTIDYDFIAGGGEAALLFSATDSNNFFMWQINGSTRMLNPHIKESGTWHSPTAADAYALEAVDLSAVMGTTEEDITNKVFHCRIVVSGNVVETWLSSDTVELTRVYTYTHTQDIPLKLLGVRHYNKVGYYDNLTVTDADGKEIYRNDFSSSNTNDIYGDLTELENGMLKVGSTSCNVIYLQQASTNLVPGYRKSLTVKEGLVSAKLYTAGLGVYESYINGQRVGRMQADGSVVYDELKPGFTQRNKRQFYSSFDVTWMLSQGENVLGGVVTGGWWTAVGSLHKGTETAYLARLILTYEDGSQEIINTDTTWKAARQGALKKTTGIWAGERYDATVDQSWMLPGFDDSSWTAPVINTEFTGELEAWEGVSIIVREDLERVPQSLSIYSGVTGAVDGTSYGDVVTVSTHQDGETITLPAGQTLLVDFGQNFAGWEYIEIEGARGTVVTVEHGEWLNEAGGNIERGNDGPGGSLFETSNRGATANTIYTMSGEGVEKYHPGFTYYGFQYMEITATADITIHRIRGQVVTSVHSDTATMVTSDADVNQLLSNATWGMYSNYLSVPTDCPQRNERMGWTGDAQVFTQAGTYLTYSKSFLMKYLQDLRDSQREQDGAYPDIAPYVHDYGTSYTDEWGNSSSAYGEVGWGDAGIIIPWYLYMMYGDTAVIEENWTAMRKYMDVFMESTDGNGPTLGARDHLNLEDNGNLKPVGDLLGVAYYAWDALMMADMAEAIGEDAVAAHYRAVYEEEKAIFQARYVDEDGSLKRWEQTALLYALYLDLLPNEESVAAVTDQLVNSIAAYGNTMMTGFLGTSIITKTLTKVGRADVAYTLLLQHNYPSWLYSVDQGATTMWERWNTYTEADGFGPASMTSFNHFAYGSVAGWMYETVAGIGYDTEDPGFKSIILAPQFDGRLSSVSSSYESAYGLIETSSRLTGSTWTYTATIPANTTAKVRIPVEEGLSLTVNGKALTALTTGTDGIVYTGTENGIAQFDAVAASFTFTLAEPAVESGEDTDTATSTGADWSQPQYCQHCQQAVTWTPVTSLSFSAAGHYYLADNVDAASVATLSGSSICLHLNGKTVTVTGGGRVFNVNNQTLNILDHAEDEGKILLAESTANRGGIFNVIVGGKLNIYGGTMMLAEDVTAYHGAVLFAESDCVVHMYGGTIADGAVSSSSSTKDGGNIYLDGSAEFYLHGGTVKNGTCPSFGGNICVTDTARFEMYGGAVTEGESTSFGGNIYLNGTAHFEMDGGTVSYGKTTSQWGGNICMISSSTANIDGGTVSYGETANGGGNICTKDSSKLTVNGGLITQGKTTGATYGGGNIFLQNTSAVIINGGTVSYGSTSGKKACGGNISLYHTSTVTINGGTVSYGSTSGSSAYGGNIYVYSTASTGALTVNGGSVVYGTASATAGGNICTATSSTTTINGGTVGYGSAPKSVGGNIFMTGSSKINMHGGTVTGGTAGTHSGNIRMGNTTTLTIDETVGKSLITLGTAPYGGNISIQNKGATLTLNAGTISYGRATGTGTMGGGNVCIETSSTAANNTSKFVMNGGTVTYGRSESTAYGGNIHALGTFTMNGGTVSRGWTTSDGANICVNKGTSTIAGGFVGDALRGGNIVVTGGQTLTVEGGTLSGALHSGSEARNILIWDSGKLNVSGGTLLGCYSGWGGCVRASKGAIINITGGTFSGSAKSDIALDMAAGSNAANDAQLTVSDAKVGSIYLADNHETYGVTATFSGALVADKVIRAGSTKPVIAFALTEGAAVTVCDDAEGEVFGTGTSTDYITSNNGLVPALDGTNLVWTVKTADPLAFSGASVVLQDDLALNFKVKTSLIGDNGYSDPYVVFSFNGAETTVTDYTVKDERYVFTFRDIAPDKLGDTVTATLYATLDGELVVSTASTYSVKQYCDTMLTKYADDTALCTLLSDILHYGAAAQTYTGYCTDSLVNDGVTGGTTAEPALENHQTIGTELAEPEVTWDGGGLKLEESIAVRLKFTVENTEELTARLFVDGQQVSVSSTFVATGEENQYYVYFKCFTADQMRQQFTVTFYRGETQVSNTLTYSMESYIYAKANASDSSEALKALVIAAIKYGDAVSAYLN